MSWRLVLVIRLLVVLFIWQNIIVIDSATLREFSWFLGWRLAACQGWFCFSWVYMLGLFFLFYCVF